jgi:hypothetical protein
MAPGWAAKPVIEHKSFADFTDVERGSFADFTDVERGSFVDEVRMSE